MGNIKTPAHQPHAQVMNPSLGLSFPKAVQRDRLAYAACVYILLWLILWYAARIVDVLGGASLWYPPAGLRFCAFVLFGWPALLLELTTTLIASLLQFAFSGLPLPGLLTAQMGWLVYAWCAMPIAYAVVLFPLRLTMRGQSDLARPAKSISFISVVIATSMFGAVVGTGHLVYSGIVADHQWTHAVASWFIGDFIGIITLSPLLFVRVWPRIVHYFQGGHWNSSHGPGSIAMDRNADLHILAATLLAPLLVFGIPKYLDLNLQFPLIALLLLLPLAAVTLRYGLRGAVLAVALLDGGLVLSVALLQQQELALQYQLVMLAIALVGLWLGGAVESRNRLMADYTKELQNEVERQTLALQQATQDLHKKREEAEQANLAKSKFLAAASHDLRQPAHALGMFMDRLDQLSTDPQSRGLLASASAAVREMQDMLDCMFDLSRLDSGSAQTEIQTFPVMEVFDTLRSGLENEAIGKGLLLRIRPSTAWLQSDPAMLRRTLLNLVSNSIRYTNHGTVMVACRPTQAGTHARIEVRDSGIGIAPEDHEKVFQEFYQVANPERDRRSGSGVGLSIVERCCRLLEHPLSLQSSLGAGTRVTLRVPLAKARPAVATKDVPLPPVPSEFIKHHVMVIEDDVMGRLALTGLLESWGYSVTAVDGAKMAIDLWQKDQPPDLIISDFRLGGGINGIEAVRKLHEIAGRNIAACVISGDTDAAVRQQAKDFGLVLLSKPVRPAKLRSLLTHLTFVDSEENGRHQTLA
jgi:signal transduction histidine kinase/ActR/RegA family two-component response regulator